MGRLRHEVGQTVVLFAMLLPVFLGLGAIAVDIGYWYVVQKTAQDAADAAALAAARELPDCPRAVDVGRAYGLSNMPNATVIPSCSALLGASSTSTGRVEVTVVAEAETFFGRIFGLLSTTISERAVAERLNKPGTLAIFAHDNPLCRDGRGVEFDAENVAIYGHIHSNSRFRIAAGPFWAADGTISRNCTASIELDVSSQFGQGTPPNREPRGVKETLPWPAWFTPSEFGWLSGCTYQGATIEIEAQQVTITGPDKVIAHGGTLPSGTYCASESLSVTGDGIAGTVTLLSPSIAVASSHTKLSPYSGDMLFFAVPNSDYNPDNDGSLEADGDPDCQPSPASDMVLNGEGHEWRGVIFSPCGRVVANFTSGSNVFVGVILGHQVRVDADDFAMIGKSDFEVGTALVE